MGVMGYDTITLANLPSFRQEISAVNYSVWNGDGITAGVLGLSYPALTSAFNTSDPSDRIPYSPILHTMYSSGLIEPVFALTVGRALNGTSG
jgi:hypothetical protein